MAGRGGKRSEGNTQTGGATTRRGVADMQNTLFADAISTALQTFDADVRVYQSEKPGKTADLRTYARADIFIMEAPPTHPGGAPEDPGRVHGQFRLRFGVRHRSPGGHRRAVKKGRAKA